VATRSAAIEPDEPPDAGLAVVATPSDDEELESSPHAATPAREPTTTRVATAREQRGFMAGLSLSTLRAGSTAA